MMIIKGIFFILSINVQSDRLLGVQQPVQHHGQLRQRHLLCSRRVELYGLNFSQQLYQKEILF